MTNYKQSLESNILKARLNRLMESLEKTNTSKMILERYYANICTLEISEGSSTSKEVQAELKSLGLNESKIISVVSSSVVPERKGVADHFAIQKIAILENICKELNPYAWMKSVSTFIAETEDFMRNNEMSILLERIVFDLENDRNANYYKEAINTISEASISENPVYFILENTKDQKWIPLVKRLYEYCESKKGSVNGTNPNFIVSKIYSPIEFIEERGSYIFNANGKIFETDGDTIMEYSYPTSAKFKSLLAITEKSKFDNGVMRLYPNSTSTLDINFNEEKPKVFINNKLVESTNVESHLLAGGYVSYSEREKIAQIQQAIHEGNNIKELDFGYTVNSRLYETVSVSVFSLGENVYIQKVNKGMKENTLTKAESAEDAVAIVKEFMNYDISNSIKHLTEAEEAKKMSKEKEVSKQLDYLNSVYEKETETIRTRIKTLTESLENLDRVARLNGVENTTKIVQAKSLLESQINKAKEALDEQESLIKSESKKLSSLDEAVDSALIDKAIKISDNMNITEFECDYADLLVKTFKADKSKIFSIVASDTDEADFTSSQAKVLDTVQDYILKNGKKIKTPEAPEVYVLDNLILINSGMAGESYQMYALKESVVNESALEIAGGIVLGLVGLKAIGFLAKGIFGTMKLKLMKDPNKLKDLAEKIYDQAITKDNKKLLQGALWVNAVKSMIDKGEIKDGWQLFKTSLAMDKIDTSKIFEDEGFDLTDSLNESCTPGKEYKIKGVAGWIYQGSADGVHIFNNDKGGFDPKNYNDEEFAKAHSTGEISECGMM